MHPAHAVKYSRTLHLYLSVAEDDILWQLSINAALWAASMQMHSANTVKYSSTLHMCLSVGQHHNLWQLNVNAASWTASMQMSLSALCQEQASEALSGCTVFSQHKETQRKDILYV